MTRVSTAEMYDDKDVITQICKLKDGLNGALGGIITEMTVDGNDLVVEFADGTSIELPLPNPTGISSITGTVSGGNLTMTIYMTDGSSHAFTCPLNGMASEAYVDTKDAQNVKLTGAQTVAGVKTFSDSPVVPDTPATEHSATNQTWAENSAYSDDTVNNLLHKEGAETKTGALTIDRAKWTDGLILKNRSDSLSGGINSGGPHLVWVDNNGTPIATIRALINTNGTSSIQIIVKNSNGTEKSQVILSGDVI